MDRKRELFDKIYVSLIICLACTFLFNIANIISVQREKTRDLISIRNMNVAFSRAMGAYLSSNKEENATLDYKYMDDSVIIAVHDVEIKSHNADDWSDEAEILPFLPPEDIGESNLYSMVFSFSDGKMKDVYFQ